MARTFLITGYPGVGKLTVASALVGRINQGGGAARLVDNHTITNPVFGVVDQDGLTPLPDGVWRHVGLVADTVMSAVVELTPDSWDVVFTANLDRADTLTLEFGDNWVEAIAVVAERRGSRFVDIELVCDLEENVRRIQNPGRRDHMKSIDPNEPERLARQGLTRSREAGLVLDVTTLAPDKAAEQILDFALSGDSAYGG